MHRLASLSWVQTVVLNRQVHRNPSDSTEIAFSKKRSIRPSQIPVVSEADLLWQGLSH